MGDSCVTFACLLARERLRLAPANPPPVPTGLVECGLAVWL